MNSYIVVCSTFYCIVLVKSFKVLWNAVIGLFAVVVRVGLADRVNPNPTKWFVERDRLTQPFKYAIVGVIMSGFIFLFPHTGLAASKIKAVKEGNALYNNEQYSEALEKYSEALKKDSSSDVINFNMGTALYKNKDYSTAFNHFQKSLLGEDDDLKQRAYYNLGNTLYRSGIDQEDQNLPVAIESLQQALGYYEKSLGLNQSDQEAEDNHVFVKRELERLKEKLQQNQQQKGQGQSQENKQEKSNDSEDQQQSQQQQSNQKDQNQSDQDQASGEQNQKSEQEQGEQSDDQQAQSDQQNQRDGEQQKQNQGSAQEGQEKDDQNRQASSEDLKQMSEQEARMFLENYKQNEEPQQLLDLIIKRQLNSRPVTKDW